ncbi:MAG: tetratricopeptide repeat protein [Planctomycetia bacterium]|nr:tetratricopeptide repeat protein [Planctomycetia bacterium]
MPPPSPAPDDPPAPSVRARLGAAGVALAVLVLPALLERGFGAPDDDALRIPAVLAVLAVGLFVVARRPVAEPSATLGALALVAALLPVVTAATILRPTDVSMGVFGPTAVALSTAAALVVGGRLSAPASRAVLEGLAVAGVVAAAWVVVDRVAGRPAVGPFGRSGVAGPALAVLAFAAHGALRGSRAGSLAAGGAALLLAAGIVATGSRTGLAAAAAGALAVVAATGRGRARTVALVGLGLGVVGIGLLASGVRVPGLARDTVDVRLGLLRTSAALVAERPLTGHGVHGFSTQALRVRDLEEARISAGGRPLAAHGDVAHAAVEGGVFAGLATLLLLAGGVLVTARAARAAAAGPRVAGAGIAGPAVAGLAVAVATFVAALAEDPLLSAAVAPVFGLVVGAAGPVVAGPDDRSRRGRLRSAFLCASAAAFLTGVVDHAVALRQVGTPAALERGSFLGTEGLRARGYDAAAAAARAGDFPTARERYARLLAWDPGATEARLDVAETYRLEGRLDDALATLAEAARLDPTRFDVPHRRGHLHLGGEAPPSRRAAPAGAVEALKAYNEASALAPGRFETQVAYARVHRRRGDLAAADHALEAAANAAARAGSGVPAEVLVETFRLAEAVGAPLADSAKTLELALRAGPRVAGEVRAEADAALDAAAEADRAAAAARERGGEAEAKRREALAQADRDAAAVRLTGLLRSGLLAPAAVRAAAQRAATARDGPRAVTLYRALLSDPYGVRDVGLVLEARAAAAGVDAARADAWAALGRTMLGVEALERGDAAAAAREFEAALARDGADALALFGFARALAALDRRDEAARALERAVKADPAAWDAAFGSADLGPLLPPRRP